MTTSQEIIDHIQKYSTVDLFLILNKHGNKLNNDEKISTNEKEKKPTFNQNYSEIPRLVEKASNSVRDIDPLNELVFMQISYCNENYLIAPDGELCVFTAVRKQDESKEK